MIARPWRCSKASGPRGAHGQERAGVVVARGQADQGISPRYNISFRDDKKFLLVKVNLNDPFPRFQLTRMKKDDGSRYFGPSLIRDRCARRSRSCARNFTSAPAARNPGEVDFRHCSSTSSRIAPRPA